MDKFWIFFACLAIFSVVGYAENSNEWASDEWYDDDVEKTDLTSDKKVEEQIQNYQIENVESLNKGDIDDYQIEDNRSELKGDIDEDDDYADYLYPNDIELQDKKSDGNDEYKELQDSNNSNDNGKNDFEQILEKDENDEMDYVLSPVHEEEQKKILEETSAILNEDDDDNFEDEDEISDIDAVNDETKKLSKEVDDTDKADNNTHVSTDQKGNEKYSTESVKKSIEELEEDEEDNEEEDDEEEVDEEEDDEEGDNEEALNPGIQDVIDENKKALEETTKAFGDGKSRQDFKDEELSEDNLDEDTVDKAYKDLQDDLAKLRETWNKLRDDVDDEGIKKEDLPGFEEINSKLSDIAYEGLDNDYEKLDDKSLSKIFEEMLEESDGQFAVEETDDKIEDTEKEDTELKSDAYELPEKKTFAYRDSDKNEKGTENAKLIKYVDDALVANDIAETTPRDMESSTIHDDSDGNGSIIEHKVLKMDDSSEIADILLEEVRESGEAKRITLSVDKPVILTSENYPNPYPTNTVTDWILEGDGMGIEFNVTDFSVNGNNGDYVLVNPGRTDASGSDGLLFSHMLREERRYRFLNVDRMFIRFHTNMGMMWQRGFNFSIKMIDSLPEEVISEPEALPIGYPAYTLTVNLGGVTLEGFLKVKEDFRRIVADMATMYIHANDIDPGLNTTLEVTQITSTALCFRNWPKFEHCAEVRFGVPLQYDDEDTDPRLTEDELSDMWTTYSRQDPFELRLRRLNITKFQIPNDSNILMVWLVIAAGVVISMAMLAFALWRFSCFEDYTRMPAFSDTESINEKKTLDLYPTPHQTLPPLYSDTEYKWGDEKFEESTRVDMSGFANRSYVRTDDYDFESDEEVVVPARDRNGSISPRDIYNV